ncbi:hypothetical protein D3C72_1680290 [compost metagenome]
MLPAKVDASRRSMGTPNDAKRSNMMSIYGREISCSPTRTSTYADLLLAPASVNSNAVRYRLEVDASISTPPSNETAALSIVMGVIALQESLKASCSFGKRGQQKSTIRNAFRTGDSDCADGTSDRCEGQGSGHGHDGIGASAGN